LAAGSPSNTNVPWAEAYLHTKWHLDACSRLATIEVGRKLGRGLCPLFGEGRVGSPSNTKSPGLRPSSILSGILIHAAIWPQQIWAENWVGAVPLWGGGAGSPSNTKSPGPRSTSIPSGILIHPAIWPQQMWTENWRGLCCAPLGEEKLGPHLTQCGQGRGLPACQVSS